MTEQPTPDTDDLDSRVADFDEFWAQQDRKGQQVRMFGETITLPPALPLQFELEAKRLQRSKSDKDVRSLVALLLGEGTVERWSAKGMDGEQFAVLLLWASANVAGSPMTMAEAHQAFKDQAGEPAPKPPTKNAKRTSGRSS